MSKNMFYAFYVEGTTTWWHEYFRTFRKAKAWHRKLRRMDCTVYKIQRVHCMNEPKAIFDNNRY